MDSSRIEFPKPALSKKLRAIGAVALLTFGAFMATGLGWGGAALNGKVEDGRFYLGEHGQFREVGRGKYATSAVLSMIWPPALVLTVSQLRAAFPSDADTRKLFLVITVFAGLVAGAFSIASLICLLRVLV
jgi:hypothetical protein